MIAKGEEILGYIPQRTPIVMVDKLHQADEFSAITGFSILADNIFVHEGYFTEPGLIEHIAQSTALHAGYGYVRAGKEVPIGYIAAVKDLIIHRLPVVGDELNTQVMVVNTVMDVILVKAEVKLNGTTLASCEMRVFVKDESLL